MSGMVVTQAAGRCPELVERLVYVSAFCPRHRHSPWLSRTGELIAALVAIAAR